MTPEQLEIVLRRVLETGGWEIAGFFVLAATLVVVAWYTKETMDLRKATVAMLAETRRQRLGVASLGRKRGAGRQDPYGSTAARRKAFLQVSMEQNMGCAVGACLGCVVMGTTGVPQRVCREGPVFGSDELVWEGAWSMPEAAAR